MGGRGGGRWRAETSPEEEKGRPEEASQALAGDGSGEEEEGVMWVGIYSSEQSILLVGDGDFSFALALAAGFSSAANIVATSLDSYEISKRVQCISAAASRELPSAAANSGISGSVFRRLDHVDGFYISKTRGLVGDQMIGDVLASMQADQIDISEVLKSKYSRAESNLAKLKRMGATILHGIDAEKMRFHTDLKIESSTASFSTSPIPVSKEEGIMCM